MNEIEDPQPPEQAMAETAPEVAEEAAPVADPRLACAVEALLLAAETPLSLDMLQKLLLEDFAVDRASLRLALKSLGERLSAGAAELREVAGGWRLQVRAEYSAYVARLWQEKPPKMTRAALETLALIVYRQPITRGEIEEIRGVAVSSNILRSLTERGWIRELGVKEVLGRPTLFGTTPQFLDDFGVKSLNDLPSLPEIKDAEQLEAALARLAGEGFAAGTPADEAAEPEAPEPTPEAATDDETPPDAATLH